MVAFLGFVAVRYRERILTGLAARWFRLRGGVRVAGERVLIVGAGELGQFTTWLVQRSDLAQAFTVAGMVDDDPRKEGMRIEGLEVAETIPGMGSTALQDWLDELEGLSREGDSEAAQVKIRELRERLDDVGDQSPRQIASRLAKKPKKSVCIPLIRVP
ncbi:MAG: nucleoside-diphosphate sugar epimerase/dehydratase [Anaerolineales bacterium]